MNKKRQDARFFSVQSLSPSPDGGPRSADHPLSRSPDRLLVVGCGCPFAADDNVGLEIVHRLQARGDCSCDFLELAGGALGLLDSLEKAEIILFVDAVQSGARAGTVHLLPLPSHKVVPRAMGRLSDHGWGLQETLRLSRSLGLRIPRLMLLGVELERVTPSLSRTPSVDAAIESVVECFSELQTALRNSESPLWTGHHAYPALSHGFVNVNTDPRDQAKTANHKG